MWEHHQRAIDTLAGHFKDDPAFPALIIAGSVAKGLAREDSDIDFVLVATDEEYARRAPTNNLHYFSMEMCDYSGGYVDGKIVDLAFLAEVAERGSEPARAAFARAFVAYSRLPELDGILRRIPIYPEADRSQKIQTFYAQLQVLKWYMGEAEKRGDPYLRAHVAADLVLFGGRLILAYNKVLYPYHKWFMTELRRAPQKPDGLIALAEDLLAQPGQATADRFCDAVLSFTDWEMPPEGWPARFMHDSEWAWRSGCAAVEDW
jgi:predicted nucleotidyltransferase